MKQILIFFLLTICWIQTMAQSTQEVHLNFSYGIDLPGGDLKERFGLNFNPGIDLDLVINQKYFFGLHGHFLIGNQVKEDVLVPISTSEGLVISQQKSVVQITPKERAYVVGAHAGRFFNISKGKAQHGPRIRFGTSIFTHFIIFNDETASTVQLGGDIAKGYDRMTRGISIEEFIGYQYINQSNLLSIYGGFNLLQSFSKSLRPYDFDTGVYGGTGRLDALNGFRVGIAIKLYKTGSSKDIFY